MTVEEKIRRELIDARHTGPGWPDPVERITKGVRRRRRRHATFAGAAATLIVAGAVAVPLAVQRQGGDGDFAADSGIVAWVATPASIGQPVRRQPRPAARPCRGGDLDRNAWVPRSEDGSGVLSIAVRNVSSTRCTLDAPVSISAVRAGAAGRSAVPSQPGAVASGKPRQAPATVDPGEPAMIDIRPVGTCSHSSTHATVVGKLELSVLGQGIAVSGVDAVKACSFDVGSWYVVPPMINASSQLVTINAPAEVQRGTELTYTVNILNPSDAPLSLNPCPAYVETVGRAKETYRLNCTTSSVAPHKSITYEMRIRIPGDIPTGKSTLSWMAVMGNGEVALGNISTGGAPIVIRP